MRVAMKKLGIVSMVVLVSLPGCWGRKSVKTEGRGKHVDARMNREIADAESTIRSFFDDELGEFTNTQELLVGDAEQDFTVNDFALVNDLDKESSEFDVVYFDFDSYELKAGQEATIQRITTRIKKELKNSTFFGDSSSKPTISISGHSDDIYISQVYNLVLSENRAKVLKDRLVQEGIPAECIKIIGYGSAVPVLVDGKPVTGDRVAQAPNRRDEVRILYS